MTPRWDETQEDRAARTAPYQAVAFLIEENHRAKEKRLQAKRRLEGEPPRVRIDPDEWMQRVNDADDNELLRAAMTENPPMPPPKRKEAKHWPKILEKDEFFELIEYAKENMREISLTMKSLGITQDEISAAVNDTDFEGDDEMESSDMEMEVSDTEMEM